MNATRRVKLKDITPNITCNLCKGYFVDATTIIECLHSFCKSCIVRHLEKSEFCPVCDVQLHSTKPLSSIRSDQMLQEIVYKLVPGLFRREMARRRDFYKENLRRTPSNQMDSGQVFNELYITSDDIIHLSLEYFGDAARSKENAKRYLQCPAAVSVSILKKLIQGKYDLQNDAHIDVMYGERILPDDFLLMDIAYKYSWNNNGKKPLQLSYRIKGVPPKVTVKVEPTPTKSIPSPLPAPAKKRRSRGSVDHEPTKSEILKSSNRNLLVESSKANQNYQTPKLTPNGKVRGRKKRSLSDLEQLGNEKPKRKRASKSTPAVESKEMECQSDPIMSKSKESTSSTCTTGSIDKVVQLTISETGVISARNMLSGEEKIIKGLEKSISTSTLQPGQEKRPAHFTEELKLNSGQIQPQLSNPEYKNSLISTNEMNSKPSNTYVKLNIPNASSILSTVNPTTLNEPCKPKGNKKSPGGKSSISPNKKTPSKRKNSEKLPRESPKMAIKSNASEFQDKKANVQKALIDLEKKLYTSYSKGSLHPSEPPSLKDALKGLLDPISRNLKDQGPDLSLAKTGPVVMTSTPFTPVNGGTSLHTAFPFPLSFGSSGMTVNLIPATSSTSSLSGGPLISNGDSSPQKSNSIRAHQTKVVNGDLKFTTSPRSILPSPAKDSDSSTSPGLSSPKKPPKFFKSRISSPNLASTPSSSAEYSKPNAELVTSKFSIANGNHSLNFSNSTFSTAKSSSGHSIAQTITTPSGAVSSSYGQGHRLNCVDIIPSHVQQQLLQLQMDLAAAANKAPMNLLPYFTNSYSSLPYYNPRSLYNTNLGTALSFPFNYAGSLSSSNLGYIQTSSKNGGSSTGNSTILDLNSKTSQGTDKRGSNSLDLSFPSSSLSKVGCQDEPLSLKKINGVSGEKGAKPSLDRSSPSSNLLEKIVTPPLLHTATTAKNDSKSLTSSPSLEIAKTSSNSSNSIILDSTDSKGSVQLNGTVASNSSQDKPNDGENSKKVESFPIKNVTLNGNLLSDNTEAPPTDPVVSATKIKVDLEIPHLAFTSNDKSVKGNNNTSSSGDLNENNSVNKVSSKGLEAITNTLTLVNGNHQINGESITKPSSCKINNNNSENGNISTSSTTGA